MRAALASSSVAVLAILLLAPAALAECPAWGSPKDRELDVRFAFFATVTVVSDGSGPADPAEGDARWHVELRTGRVIRGPVPARLAYNGWAVGCHEVMGDRLRVGDRIFIGVEHLRLERLPEDPLAGDLVIWRWTGGRWVFDDGVIGWTDDRDSFLTPAVRGASTTGELVALVRAAPPDTATAPADHAVDVAASTGPIEAPLVAAGLLGLLAGFRRESRRARS